MSQPFRRLFAVAATVAASLTAVPAAAASFALRPAVNYAPGGKAGQTLAVGDLNGDRRPDIVVGNLLSEDVSVLLSKPGGGFQPATRYPANGGVGGVAIGDVNLDGHPDVAAGVGSAGVSVLHGDGAGGFAPPKTYPGDGTSVYFVAIGDLNGDGRPDLAAIGAKVLALLQKADGDFGVPWSYDAGFIPDSLAIGDLNRDGHNDLAVASQDGAAYMLGTGERVFNPLGPPQPVTAPPLYWLRIADINRDRRPDLVAADLGGANGVTLLRAASSGGFLGPQLVATERSVRSFAVADMNGDGLLDLVLGQTSPDTVGVMLRRGSGFTAPIETPLPDSPVALETADLNRDGLPDVVTANYDGDTVSVLLNSSTPTAGLSVHVLRFGRNPVGSRSASRTITVTNTGAARLRPSSLRMIGPDADEFRISGDGCTGESLPPGKACRVAVRFAPVTRGLGRAVLRIRSNDPASPATVGLHGTGVRAP